MLKLRTPEDLQRLVTDQVKESLTLDYKDSRALSKEDRKKIELCKDVSAMANSAGGQLVYGVEEDKNLPTKVDDGADPSITKEWIEQTIDSNVQPRIEGLVIHPIQLAKALGFVIDIPQATTRAPHQAPDNRYYKRQNFQSVAMEDYEVRDALRRATTPDLKVELSFLSGASVNLHFRPNDDISSPFGIAYRVLNLSPQPANHVILEFLIDSEVYLFDQGSPFKEIGMRDAKRLLRHVISSPPGIPIFQEADPDDNRADIYLRWPTSLLSGERLIDIETVVRTPGFSKTENWAIHVQGGTLRLRPPGSPWAKPNTSASS